MVFPQLLTVEINTYSLTLEIPAILCSKETSHSIFCDAVFNLKTFLFSLINNELVFHIELIYG